MSSELVTKTWYRIAVGDKLVAAQGEHLGIAVAAAEKHAGTRALAVEVAAGDEVPLGESVGKQHVVELGASDDVAGFVWPPGVLPQLGHTRQLAGAREGWALHADPNLFIVEAQLEAEQLVDVFLGMVERLPSADNLEVRVLDHFEDADKTDVWLTSRVNARKILSFLDDYDEELIANGHVQLSIYIRAHKATLRLTEHKTVVWIADDRELETEVTKWLTELKVQKLDKLERVTGVPHFHFRGPKTRNRKKLGEELYRQRLRRVDTLRTAETAG
ncbi:MAG: hypothetical protein H0T46_30075 [Deltaproteobacteria bacterium]|nr:hypothetical protein [Deltaproteobacteria bacterium]